jgi:hypothetical protein
MIWKKGATSWLPNCSSFIQAVEQNGERVKARRFLVPGLFLLQPMANHARLVIIG